jgi:hypothetical protein
MLRPITQHSDCNGKAKDARIDQFVAELGRPGLFQNLHRGPDLGLIAFLGTGVTVGLKLLRNS